MSLKEAAKALAEARAAMSEEAFQRAGLTLMDLTREVREKIQSQTADEMIGIVKKLKSGEAVSPAEIDLIKLWVVGDAESYVKMENSLAEWLEELRRLEGVLKGLPDEDGSTGGLFRPRGILEDASRVTSDITNFLGKKERVRKFETAALDGLDKSERAILAQLLTAKLQSPDY